MSDLWWSLSLSVSLSASLSLSLYLCHTSAPRVSFCKWRPHFAKIFIILTIIISTLLITDRAPFLLPSVPLYHLPSSPSSPSLASLLTATPFWWALLAMLTLSSLPTDLLSPSKLTHQVWSCVMSLWIPSSRRIKSGVLCCTGSLRLTLPPRQVDTWLLSSEQTQTWIFRHKLLPMRCFEITCLSVMVS